MPMEPPPLSGYLDCCATTPLAPEVAQRMAAVQAEAWGNPSSLHGFGMAAAEQLERSRQEMAALLGCDPEQLVFTSGGSESIHLALLGSAPLLEHRSPGSGPTPVAFSRGTSRQPSGCRSACATRLAGTGTPG